MKKTRSIENEVDRAGILLLLLKTLWFQVSTSFFGSRYEERPLDVCGMIDVYEMIVYYL